MKSFFKQPLKKILLLSVEELAVVLSSNHTTIHRHLQKLGKVPKLGNYTDEPISKILCNISDGEVIHLDRWKLDVRKNPDAEPNEEGKDAPPLTVVNNYFSFGVDAHIALEFHEAREANPQKFNSRLRNKMFYGQAGGKDLLQRRWKDLCEMCTLECDGKDLTPLLKEHRVHAIVFLNIPSYGSGTHPWNRSFGSEQRTDDGKIEVLGLTTYQMPLLQAGGHGTCLTQCTTARIVTTKTIPMQVDGEACRVNPAIIEISHLNKAPMVTKMKAKTNGARTLEQIHLKVAKLGMRDYTQHHYDKEKLKLAALPLFELNLDQDSDLQHVREALNKKISDSNEPLSDNWCFLDSCTAERFFRIDHGQEHLHYVTDICTDELFLLNPEEDPSQAAEVTTSDSSPQLRAAASAATDSTARPTDVVLPSLVRTDVSQLLEKHTESLIKAVKLGDLKAVKEIHNAGYSLLSIDAVGMTALHHSAKLGHKDVVHYLIASAPQSLLDMTDTEKGQSALHLAAANGRRNVCCMLVAAGAALSIKDNQGQTPQALARRAEDEELAQYLESKCVITNHPSHQSNSPPTNSTAHDSNNPSVPVVLNHPAAFNPVTPIMDDLYNPSAGAANNPSDGGANHFFNNLSSKGQVIRNANFLPTATLNDSFKDNLRPDGIEDGPGWSVASSFWSPVLITSDGVPSQRGESGPSSPTLRSSRPCSPVFKTSGPPSPTFRSSDPSSPILWRSGIHSPTVGRKMPSSSTPKLCRKSGKFTYTVTEVGDFDEFEVEKSFDEDDELYDFTTSSSSSEEQINYGFPDRSENESISLDIQAAYQKLTSQLSDYAAESSSSADGSSFDVCPPSDVVSTCAQPALVNSKNYVSSEQTFSSNPSNLFLNSTTSVLVHSADDDSVAPVHSRKSSLRRQMSLQTNRTNLPVSNVENSSEEILSSPVISAEDIPVLDVENPLVSTPSNILPTNISSFSQSSVCPEAELIDCPECRAECSATWGYVNPLAFDSSHAYEGSYQEPYLASHSSLDLVPSIDLDLGESTCGGGKGTKNIAPVHSRSFRSILSKRKAQKSDSTRSGKSAAVPSSRITQSLRSSHSFRVTRSATVSRSVGGSLRSSMGSYKFGSGSSLSSLPIAKPLRVPIPVAPVRSFPLSTATQAGSVALALAATHASSLALGHPTVRKLPFITPAAVRQAQIITQALADAILEEGLKLKNPRTRSLKDSRYRKDKRVKIERLI
ncbi:Diacylglycerol kinase accessory domain [Trinorchestia longiramus]|nr:Diacylglycerol kinase accessory domain [Trinorchestia longiramus]